MPKILSAISYFAIIYQTTEGGWEYAIDARDLKIREFISHEEAKQTAKALKEASEEIKALRIVLRENVETEEVVEYIE